VGPVGAATVVGGAIGLPNSSTYVTRWIVSTNEVGVAAGSACFDCSEWASAVANEATVARKPDVARPVARMRPAAAA